jgi:hypothetical protein
MHTIIRLSKFAFAGITLAACSGVAPTAEDTGEASSAIVTPKNNKKKICTVFDDPFADCGTNTNTTPPIQNDYVSAITNHGVTVNFDTNLSTRAVDVVVGPGFWAPVDEAAAVAVPGAKLVPLTGLASESHDQAFAGLDSCARHWYGIYVGGSLMRDGAFDTAFIGATETWSVTHEQAARNVTAHLNVPPDAHSGRLDVALVPKTAGALAPPVSHGDSSMVGSSTRVVYGMSPNSNYDIKVTGCGVTWTDSLTTDPLGKRYKRWRSDAAAGGASVAANLYIDDAGHWSYGGWADESKLYGHDYGAVMTLQNPHAPSSPFVFVQTGTVHGKAAIGSSHDEWQQDGFSADIRDYFDDLITEPVALHFEASTNVLDMVEFTGELLVGAGLVAGIVVMGASGDIHCTDGWYRAPDGSAGYGLTCCSGGGPCPTEP